MNLTELTSQPNLRPVVLCLSLVLAQLLCSQVQSTQSDSYICPYYLMGQGVNTDSQSVDLLTFAYPKLSPTVSEMKRPVSEVRWIVANEKSVIKDNLSRLVFSFLGKSSSFNPEGSSVYILTPEGRVSGKPDFEKLDELFKIVVTNAEKLREERTTLSRTSDPALTALVHIFSRLDFLFQKNSSFTSGDFLLYTFCFGTHRELLFYNFYVSFYENRTEFILRRVLTNPSRFVMKNNGKPRAGLRGFVEKFRQYSGKMPVLSERTSRIPIHTKRTFARSYLIGIVEDILKRLWVEISVENKMGTVMDAYLDKGVLLHQGLSQAGLIAQSMIATQYDSKVMEPGDEDLYWAGSQLCEWLSGLTQKVWFEKFQQAKTLDDVELVLREYFDSIPGLSESSQAYMRALIQGIAHRIKAGSYFGPQLIPLYDLPFPVAYVKNEGVTYLVTLYASIANPLTLSKTGKLQWRGDAAGFNFLDGAAILDVHLGVRVLHRGDKEPKFINKEIKELLHYLTHGLAI